MLPIILWSLGAVVALAAPVVVYFTWRSRWVRLEETGALLKGGPYRPEEVDRAIAAFKSARSLETVGLLVELRDGAWFEHPTAPGQRLSGIALSERSIIVAVPERAPLGRTALFHELMHAHLEQAHGLERTRHEAWTEDDHAVVSELQARFR